jgi:hypothetical protein
LFLTTASCSAITFSIAHNTGYAFRLVANSQIAGNLVYTIGNFVPTSGILSLKFIFIIEFYCLTQYLHK